MAAVASATGRATRVALGATQTVGDRPYGRGKVSLPLWALFTIAFGSPILAFLGVLLAQVVARKAAQELETRSKREETMRSLRWAAELAVSQEDRMADLGVAELVALLDSDLLDDSEKVFVETALDTVYQDPEAELEAAGDDAEVVWLRTTKRRRPTELRDLGVSSDEGGKGNEDGGDSDG